MQNTRLMLIQALSPLHPGTGQSVADIDLPIAREKATGLPYLPGSSVKGVLRDACGDKLVREDLFGPKPDDTTGPLWAGMLQFTDMHLLLLPIRSMAGTFAWVTSPYVLRRFARTAKEATVPLPDNLSVPGFSNEQQCYVAQSSSLVFTRNEQRLVCLEDLVLQPHQNESDQWADFIAQQCFSSSDWQGFLRERFCVVHDNVFSFLLQTATEIIARIQIDSNTKVVTKGGLWYEEALPAETILAGMVAATPLKRHQFGVKEGFEQLGGLIKDAMQFGGNATVGRGLCYVTLRGGK